MINLATLDHPDYEVEENNRSKVLQFPENTNKQTPASKYIQMGRWTLAILLFYTVAFGTWTVTGAIRW